LLSYNRRIIADKAVTSIWNLLLRFFFVYVMNMSKLMTDIDCCLLARVNMDMEKIICIYVTSLNDK